MDTIKSNLENSGLAVQKYDSLEDANNVKYPINLKCTSKEHKNTIGIELVLHDDLFSNIIRIGTYQLNLKNHYIFLASLRSHTEQEKDLAKIYGILLVSAENVDGLSQKLLEYIQNIIK